MRIEEIKGSIIDLGYEGENYATKIVFTAPDDWELNNNVAILFDFPKFKKPLAIEPSRIEGNKIELIVTDKITLAGFGQLQFVLTKPNTDFYVIYNHLTQVDPNTLIIKSRVFDTICRKALSILEKDDRKE